MLFRSDPGAFVIGGGVSEAGDLLMAPLASAYTSRVLVERQQQIPLLPATLRNDAGLVGAADLVRHRAALTA